MEVHLWRGSAKQQALRDQSRPSGQFAYFDKQLGHPNWEGKSVLDFGGNRGNLLLNRDCAIRHEQYYCMDVLKGAIDEGRERFPKAHWIHYDRYNCSFNPEGIEGLPVPDLGIGFDFILAFSVFTHTTREEMHDLVGQLRSRLAPDGALAFTFIDPHFRSWPETHAGNNLQWRLERFRETNRSLDVDALVARSLGAAWCALVDGSQIFMNSNGVWENEAQACMTYDVFYTANFLQREFPEAEILPPVNGQMQHCCIIRRSALADA
jgi:SAM-dependent methyltransferase